MEDSFENAKSIQEQNDVGHEQQENCDVEDDLVEELLLGHFLHNHISFTHLGIDGPVVLVNVGNDVALAPQICVSVLHNHVSVSSVFFYLLDLTVLLVLSVDVFDVLVAGVLLHLVV